MEPQTWDTPENWRNPDRAQPMRRNLFGSQRDTKFCPGKRCCTWINNWKFAPDHDSDDGLARFCNDCTTQHEQRTHMKRLTGPFFGHKSRSSAWFASEEFDERVDKAATGGYRRDKDGSHDKFALHKVKYFAKHGMPEQPVPDELDAVVHKRVAAAAQRASDRFGVKINPDANEIARHLFMSKKYICGVTNAPLTRECFADHHAVYFQVADTAARDVKHPKLLKVICSECTRLCSIPATVTLPPLASHG